MNVIWIIADTLRRDALGVYGNKTIRTPSLDTLAARSTRFNRHYAANFPTVPARADFLTGRWTMSYMQWEPLHEGEVTLPQILFRKGITTAGVVDTPFYLRREMNYDRGFKYFYEIPGQADTTDPTWVYESDRFAPRTFTQAMKWLERHHKENFFLYIDTWDPHEPWDAPSYYTELYWPGYDGEIIYPVYGHWRDVPGYTEEKIKKAIATYWGEVTMVDTWVGYLMRHLENLNISDKTAIIFTTDHGYYFGDHPDLFGKATQIRNSVREEARATGSDTKSLDTKEHTPNDVLSDSWGFSPLYEEITDIPLIIHVPGSQPDVYNGLTSAVDLMPTVLEIMGQEIPASIEGKSLLPAVKNTSTPGREYVLTTHLFVNPGECVRSVDDVSRKMAKSSATTVTTAEWTLIYVVDAGLSELYHLPSDPRQEKNIIKERPEIARQLHQYMVEFMRETGVPKQKLEPRLELRL
jgi:arylsulfatase A-like enzyme